MKQVKNDEETEIVSIDNVDISKYYGVFIERTKFSQKGFITKDNREGKEFKVSCSESITVSNSFGWRDISIIDLIIDILSIKNCSVFEFSTPQELFKWLSEDDEK